MKNIFYFPHIFFVGLSITLFSADLPHASQSPILHKMPASQANSSELPEYPLPPYASPTHTPSLAGQALANKVTIKTFPSADDIEKFVKKSSKEFLLQFSGAGALWMGFKAATNNPFMRNVVLRTCPLSFAGLYLITNSHDVLTYFEKHKPLQMLGHATNATINGLLKVLKTMMASATPSSPQQNAIEPKDPS
ncbi:MAG TPA: hypothetical protein VEK38_03700 [Candidatus Bathyarchaeia archaeon]|nr:hypothetical protein [Candidatus Bathyarchaeia archaeon]